MKTKIAGLIVGALSLCVVISPTARAIDLRINLGDRAYYEGPSYWDDGYEWVWVAGHRGPHGRWIHGHYERRGVFVKIHAGEHHKHHHHDND